MLNNSTAFACSRNKPNLVTSLNVRTIKIANVLRLYKNPLEKQTMNAAFKNLTAPVALIAETTYQRINGTIELIFCETSGTPGTDRNVPTPSLCNLWFRELNDFQHLRQKPFCAEMCQKRK